MYFFLMIFSFLPSLQAKEDNYDVILEGSFVSVPKDKIVEGDYCSLGNAVIEGTVNGDVYLIGAEATIMGEIKGDLIVFGGSVFLGGRVLGNVHIFSGQAILEGFVGGDVAFIGANLLLPGTSEIGGNLFVIAGNTSLESVVDGDVFAIVASFSISGVIKKNVRSFVNRLRIASGAKILGTLKYRSAHTASIDSEAEVVGEVTYKPTLLKDLEASLFFKGAAVGSQLFPFLTKFFYTFIVGCLLITIFPHKLQRSLLALKKRPGKSFLYGLIVILGLPILTGILLVTVIGAPFALTLLALNIISFYTVTVFSILWGANAIFRRFGFKENTVFELIIGQVAYYFLTSIPVFGVLLACVATIFGFGATIVAQTKRI